jgi:citrate synthase
MGLIEQTATPVMQAAQKRYRSLLQGYGDRPLTAGPVLVQHVLRGNRGIPGGMTDTSFVHPYKGVQFNGNLPCDEAIEKAKIPEAIFWYMLVEQLPQAAELQAFQSDLASRLAVPGYVWDVLDALPVSTHPMTQLQTATNALEGEARFRDAYLDGAPADEYWKLMLDDGLDLIAWQHQVAAYIYRRIFGDAKRLEPNPQHDWSEQFVRMSGLADPDGHLTEYMRVYFITHTDHEATNASANTGAIVNSTLATLATTLTAAYGALSGPRHGMANQESLMFIEKMIEHFGGVPTEDEVARHIDHVLDEGGVLSGFGHAQLRDIDVRFISLTNFLETIPEVAAGSDIIRCMQVVAKVAPGVLAKRPKIANPHQNIDFGSGAVLSALGFKERTFYTVLFCISRMWGIIAQAVRARAEGRPIIRPISLTTGMVEEAAQKGPKALDVYFSAAG